MPAYDVIAEHRFHFDTKEFVFWPLTSIAWTFPSIPLRFNPAEQVSFNRQPNACPCGRELNQQEGGKVDPLCRSQQSWISPLQPRASHMTYTLMHLVSDITISIESVPYDLPQCPDDTITWHYHLYMRQPPLKRVASKGWRNLCRQSNTVRLQLTKLLYCARIRKLKAIAFEMAAESQPPSLQPIYYLDLMNYLELKNPNVKLILIIIVCSKVPRRSNPKKRKYDIASKVFKHCPRMVRTVQSLS